MRRHTRTVLAIRTTFYAIATVVVLALLASSCGGGGNGGGEFQVTAAGVTLTVASPWVGQELGRQGLVVAPSDEALRSAVGPRLTVQPGSGALPDTDELIPNRGADDVALREVVDGPDTFSFGAEEGFFVQFLEQEAAGSVMRWHAFVNIDGLSVYEFIVEAPESEWDSDGIELMAIAAGATFGAVDSAAGEDEDTAPPVNSLDSFLTELVAILEASEGDSDEIEEAIDRQLAGIGSIEEALAILEEGFGRLAQLAIQVRQGVHQGDRAAGGAADYVALLRVEMAQQLADVFREVLERMAFGWVGRGAGGPAVVRDDAVMLRELVSPRVLRPDQRGAHPAEPAVDERDRMAAPRHLVRHVEPGDRFFRHRISRLSSPEATAPRL